MEANRDRYYQALVSRDARFDGHFFAGVVTTGVYCRPTCPAPDPKPINVRYFPCAAAAEKAGFRPCRRCRPETAPGTPAWSGTSATVSRALRLISEGALDAGSVDDLAERLGVGGRHLRRLFDRHLGATPVAVAQSRRIHFARNLLDNTNLPMRDVAFSSGFSSIKRFNTVIRETFGRTPTELRRSRGRFDPGENGGISLRLPYRPPYEWDATFAYLRDRAIPGVEQVVGNTYRRAIVVGDQAVMLEVAPDPDKPFVVLRLAASVRREIMEVAERVRRMFDLRADPGVIGAHLEHDPLLAPVVRAHPGLRVPGAWDPFELAVRAILGQQVSVKGAVTLAGRLVEKFGRKVPGADPSGPTHLFPGPAILAEANVARIGMPKARADAITELARRVRDGELSLCSGERPEATQEGLRSIPGVGEWTAQYVAMRGLGQPDIFLPGDLGVRKALANGSGSLPSARIASERSEPWRPWRAYAVLYLWLTLAPPGRNGKGSA